jgi:hypothetical protein
LDVLLVNQPLDFGQQSIRMFRKGAHRHIRPPVSKPQIAQNVLIAQHIQNLNLCHHGQRPCQIHKLEERVWRPAAGVDACPTW